ncbi:secreted RxLR effector protein 78-like [Lactuca sativa]|uniref:secreted RxLR effector protein 78-like n=1 Tax=Lactuca sativa TaxID=4236 RepID=UPI001C68D1B6|nr:secreted RxLR effector protein 78-like [Lactuca sativa]
MLVGWSNLLFSTPGKLDGPLLVNDMVQWFKHKKQKLMIFKVDFEKAYDSVSWDYIDRIMMLLGFAEIWRAWIRGMFSNSRSSILLNGCPTDEFQSFRGLRQGDPLSPFVFIIAMEGLHIAMEDVVSEGVFRWAQLEPHDLAISHLFYADDAIFLGEWNENNV